MYADIQPPRLCKGSGALQGMLFPQKRLPGFNISFKPASKRKNFPVLFPTVSLPSTAKLFASTKGEPPSKPGLLTGYSPVLGAQPTPAPAIGDPVPRNGTSRDWQSKVNRAMPKLLKFRPVSMN